MGGLFLVCVSAASRPWGNEPSSDPVKRDQTRAGRSRRGGKRVGAAYEGGVGCRRLSAPWSAASALGGELFGLSKLLLCVEEGKGVLGALRNEFPYPHQRC